MILLRTLIALLIALLCTSLAAAADMQAAPQYKALAAPAAKSWTGFYLGAYGGYGINTTGAVVVDTPLTIDLGSAPRGFLGGGTLGYDIQVGPNGVIGFFANAGLASLTAHGALSTANLTTLSIANATNYLGGTGARVGWLLSPDTLAYAKGGFAFGGAKPDFQAIGTSKGISDTSPGWLAGAGLEHRFTPNLSLLLEGTYTRLGDQTLALGPTAFSTARYHIVEQKLGLQYRF